MTLEEIQVEKNLLPRLQFMGYVFFFFCILSILFGFIIGEEAFAQIFTEHSASALSLERSIPPAFFLDDTPDEIELVATDIFNFYIIGAIFAAIGVCCILFARKKKKIYKS